MTMEHSYVACLLGGALGDALGQAVAASDMATIRRQYGEQGVETLLGSDFTDLTQMGLFTVEALLHWHLQSDRRDAQLNSCFYQSYLRWLHTQGDTLAPSLRTSWLLQQQGLYQQWSPELSSVAALRSGKRARLDDPLNDSQGVGALTRVGPMGLYFHRDPEKAFRLALDNAALTHGHAGAYLSAGFYAALLALLLGGQSLKGAIGDALSIVRAYPQHEALLKAVDELLERHAGGLLPTPEQLDALREERPHAQAIVTLEMSLCCTLSHPEDFRQATLAAVNHGGNSSAVALLCGQILALNHGLEAIPEDWRNHLQLHEIVRVMAADLYAVSHAQDPFAPISESLLQRHGQFM